MSNSVETHCNTASSRKQRKDKSFGDMLKLTLTQLLCFKAKMSSSSTKPIEGLFWDDLSHDRKPIYDYISLDGNTNSYVPFETLTFTNDEFGIIILQSCNGLLLCSSNALCNTDCTYYVFNPFTNKYKIFPKSQMTSHDFPDLLNVSLAFDPFKSPFYKVIGFWKDGCKYRIGIYDSETSSWRFSEFYTCNSQPESVLSRSGIFWNGSLYWCYREGSMVYFDVARELLAVMPLPSSVSKSDGRKFYHIAEYRGHLYLFQRDSAFRRCFSIYEMDAANSSWIVKGQVDVSLNPHRRSPSGSTFLPHFDNILFIHERGEGKESTKVMLLTVDSMVVSYDLKDMRFERIYDLSASQKFPCGIIKCHQYIESLACV